MRKISHLTMLLVVSLAITSSVVAWSAASAQTLTTLASFNKTDGWGPGAGLIADGKGNFFGTTYSGGASGYGTVFKVTGIGFVTPTEFPGTPGKPNCFGSSVAALTQTYGGFSHAAAALGYDSGDALQDAINSFCSQ